MSNDQKLFDMMSNCEAQYIGFGDVVEYIQSITSDKKMRDVKNIKPIYNKYMSYCIDNDLI